MRSARLAGLSNAIACSSDSRHRLDVPDGGQRVLAASDHPALELSLLAAALRVWAEVERLDELAKVAIVPCQHPFIRRGHSRRSMLHGAPQMPRRTDLKSI